MDLDLFASGAGPPKASSTGGIVLMRAAWTVSGSAEQGEGGTLWRMGGGGQRNGMGRAVAAPPLGGSMLFLSSPSQRCRGIAARSSCSHGWVLCAISKGTEKKNLQRCGGRWARRVDQACPETAASVSPGLTDAAVAPPRVRLPTVLLLPAKLKQRPALPHRPAQQQLIIASDRPATPAEIKKPPPHLSPSQHLAASQFCDAEEVRVSSQAVVASPPTPISHNFAPPTLRHRHHQPLYRAPRPSNIATLQRCDSALVCTLVPRAGTHAPPQAPSHAFAASQPLHCAVRAEVVCPLSSQPHALDR
ncbi:hypothetical protein BKA66DRAFT_596142 [Pyrenochaeta sp. MPI-SDFR-AT-0127]|nr:hypothetical protein BKA66DRAFT_596142 [Pyrenochaeta sp. MPI-SDFR-AT-0127]